MKNQTPKEIRNEYRSEIANLVNWHMTTPDPFTKKAIENVLWRMNRLFEFWDDLEKKVRSK